MAGGLRRGDVRLYRFPTPDKERPVVVLTQDSAIDHLATVTVAPITSAIRGVPSQVLLDERDGMKQPCVVNLHKLITVHKTNIGPRVASLNEHRLSEICAAMNFALGCSRQAP
jgi:mRNA interferase MazF